MDISLRIYQLAAGSFNWKINREVEKFYKYR